MPTTNAINPWVAFKEAAGAVEQEFPELWRKCYPRRYNDVGGTRYDTPKSVAHAMMDAFLGFHMADAAGQTEQNEALWASTMVKYGVPTYYLSHDMALALTKTTPTEVLDCLNIALPFDAAAFMLPTDILTHDQYGPVAFVGYSRNMGGTSIDCPHPAPPRTFTLHCINDSFSIFVRTVTGHMLHWTYNTTMRLVDLKNDEELEELQKNYSHTSVRGAESQDFTPADIVTMTRAIKFLFNVILLITHKPELIEPARLLKRVQQRQGPIEYWQPHVIGRTYKLRYERREATGTHASPRGHWVSGFWREQAHGPQHSLRKTLWIEPFWRGGKLA